MGQAVPTISLTLASSSQKLGETLFPVSNGLPDCDMDEWATTTGDAYECIDENPHDGNASYIFIRGISPNSGSSNVSYSEFVEIEDTSIPSTSVINYVRITAVIKSCTRWDLTNDGTGCENGQPATNIGFAKLLATTDNCSSITESELFSLNVQLTEAPTGLCYDYDTETSWYSINLKMFTDMNGNPWTTGAINDLTIGIKGTADDAYGRRDNEFPLESCVSNTNWEESAGADWIITVQDNLDADYLHTDDIGAVLAYTIDDGPTSEWSIHQGLSDGFYNGITISSRSCRNAVTGNAKYKMFVKYNGTFYYSSEYTRNSTTYVTSNWDMVTRPWDAQPWENSDFDPATTEFGIEVTDLSEVGLRLRVTEFHITPEIEFGMGELRCTQMYATVVYSEPTPTPCLLPKPIDIQVNCDYETMGLNFWSGNREVYSLGRSSKRTSLSGVMWDGCTNGVDTCEDIIACIRALAKLQKPIEIDGLRYDELNCIYNILSFSWKQVSECPNTYDWNLELEFAHSCCTV